MAKVKDIMTEAVQTVTADTPIVEAARLMADVQIGALPVMEGGRLTGMITDRDIVLRVVAELRDPQSTLVREVATLGQVATIDPESDLKQAAEVMAQAQVRRLPVWAGDRVVGIISLGDVALDDPGKTSGKALEGVSTPSPRGESLQRPHL